MKLSHLIIREQDDQGIIQCLLNDRKRIILKFDKKYIEYAQSTFDGFLILMLVVAMKEEEDIEINGVISRKLYHQIKKHLMPIIKTVHPTYSIVDIIVEGFSDEIYDNNAVACGLSCGVDSLSCLEDHYFQKKELTHVTNFYAGAYSVKDTYHNKMKNIHSFVDKTELELFIVDTNFHLINNFEHQYFHTLRNLAIPLFFQKLFKKYYYGSSFSYRDSKMIPNSGSITSCEPILIPHLSTENLSIEMHGCQYTRVKKTQLLMHNPFSYNHLDVCVHPTYYDSTDKKLNCSKCFKCLRTLCTLDYLGYMDKYEHVFDFEIYKKHKHNYLVELEKTNPYDRELIQLFYEYNPIIEDYLLNSQATFDDSQNLPNVFQEVLFSDSQLNHNFHARRLKENIWYALKDDWTLIDSGRIQAKKNCIIRNKLQIIPDEKQRKEKEKNTILILQEIQDQDDFYCTFIC